MTLTPLVAACPKCGSTADIVYSCKPECCFNHVCARCYTTFELATTKAGEFSGEIGPIPPDPDPSGPTAPCERCGECRIFAISDGLRSPQQYLCVSCNALLTLDYAAVVEG